MTEIWKTIPSLPAYEASNLGRLRCIPTQTVMPHGGFRQHGGKPITGQWDGSRYVLAYRGKTYKVARLVCEALHGPAPEGQPNCLHLDENARNNRPDNLKWGTQKENLNAPGFLAYCRSRTGENSPTTKGRQRRTDVL